MKRLAIAIAATLTAATPVVFAQYYEQPRDYNDRYNSDQRADTRDWRAERDARADRDYRGDRARVIETTPVAASGREECWNPRSNRYEASSEPKEHSKVNAGTIIGGIAGGILGHQVGSGRGNTAATIGGAALGAYGGNEIEKRRESNQDDLDHSRCRAMAGDTQGYDVRYAYRGQEYVARMDHDPGRFVELGRDVNADCTPY